MRLLLGLLIFFSSTICCFAGSSTGKVTRVYVHTGGQSPGIIMFAAGSHTNRPACGSNDEEWAVSLKDELGKAMYSIILSAAAQGKVITVHGAGDCNDWGGRERPLWIRVDY